MSSNGSNAVALVNSGTDAYPVYSPDGSKIAFVRIIGGIESEIIVMNASGSNASAVASGQYTSQDLSWQPLTRAPATNTPDKLLSVPKEGSVSITIPDLYTDAYEGVDAASLTITNNPTKGTLNVASGGVVTYTKTKLSSTNTSLFSQVMNYFVPTVSAQSADDSFTYQICSISSSQLCATGTVSLAFAGTTTASTNSLAGTGLNHQVITYISLLLIASGLLGKLFLKRVQFNE